MMIMWQKYSRKLYYAIPSTIYCKGFFEIDFVPCNKHKTNKGLFCYRKFSNQCYLESVYFGGIDSVL